MSSDHAKLILSTYWRSSCSFRARIALNYKKLAYESKHVNILTGEQKTPEYRAQNPIGHVPTLHIDGVTYVESVAIMELLEELYPDPPLLPKTPAGSRARPRPRRDHQRRDPAAPEPRSSSTGSAATIRRSAAPG